MVVLQVPVQAVEVVWIMPDKALIIFVKDPVPGKVKTRLIPAVGEETATAIYKTLLSHTERVCSEVQSDRFVFYADEVVKDDIWRENLYIKKAQQGGDLGERMSAAFHELFNEAYKRIVIIGSDCPELTAVHIREAFEFLKWGDAVIGPAFDGGYYLLGLRVFIEEVFMDKSWSTDSVFAGTISDFEKLGLNYKVLDSLHDLDRPEDLRLI